MLLVFGVMNIAAMLVLAVIVLLEKVWSRGVALSRAVGIACLGLAIAVVFVPSLAAYLLVVGGVVEIRRGGAKEDLGTLR